MNQEDVDKYFPSRNIPKGWVSIEEHLPMMLAIDFISQGFTMYKVKAKDGKEYYSPVCDHNTWYYEAKEDGITHWFNDDSDN